jgi:bile acid:Na+ symporter, BASS family
MQILVILLVSLTIAEMMFAMGLRVSVSELRNSAGNNRSLTIRTLIANYIIIPGVTILVIKLFHLTPWAAAGLLILGVSPAAPYALPFTILARGNLVVSTGLMVILAGTSAIIAPWLLHFLLPIVSGNDLTVIVSPQKLIGTLFVMQLIPLFAGLMLRHWRPVLSSRLLIPAGHVSKILNVLMIGTIVILQFNVMTATRLNELFMMLLLVAAGVLAGWIVGWPGKENRISVSIITAMRNMSLSMGIAVTSFPGTPVVATILAFSFVAGTGVLIFALVIRQIR